MSESDNGKEFVLVSEHSREFWDNFNILKFYYKKIINWNDFKSTFWYKNPIISTWHSTQPLKYRKLECYEKITQPTVSPTSTQKLITCDFVDVSVHTTKA